jgi:hypothetical protein
MTKRVLSVLLLAGALSGCATMSGTAGQAGAAADPAVATTAQSLGIKDTLVQVAITAARNFLGKAQSGAAATAQDASAIATQKEDAAKAGVQAAVDKAKTDGAALTEPQQTGLMAALKNLL